MAAVENVCGLEDVDDEDVWDSGGSSSNLEGPRLSISDGRVGCNVVAAWPEARRGIHRPWSKEEHRTVRVLERTKNEW